jgi:hypothetical protein
MVKPVPRKNLGEFYELFFLIEQSPRITKQAIARTLKINPKTVVAGESIRSKSNNPAYTEA